MDLHTSQSRIESNNDRKRLSVQITEEHERAYPFRDMDVREAGKPSINSSDVVSNEEYLAMFDVYDEKEIETALNATLGITARRPKGISADDLAGAFDIEYAEGMKFCAAFLPFDDFGDEKDDMDEDSFHEWIKGGAIVRKLLIETADNLTTGFGDTDGYYFDYLPECLKRDVDEGGCTFELKFEFSPGDPRNKETFLKKYRQAVGNLRAMLLK